MKTFAKTAVRTLGFACLWLAASNAEAATPRAYVSVNGNDANTCNVPATPCRTYTGAISQVTPGGTVIVMDSGTFGGGTISQAVTINAPLGVVALAATPIIVNPGSGNTVVLRGLTFQAAVPGSGTGIAQQSGTLFVENTVVDGWLEGLVSNPGAEQLFVKGSVFRNQVNNGLRVLETSTVRVTVDDSFFENNGYATGFAGLFFQGGSGRVTKTVITRSYGGVVLQNAGTDITLQRCEAVGNAFGFWSQASTILRVSQSTVTGNSTGLLNSTGTLESFGNNVVRGNSTDTFGGVTTVALQ
jgi:hypothetical protein